VSRSAPHPRVVIVDGVPTSALVAESPDPRAVVVALHGGATTSAYFDCPGRPRLSLLRTGAALGFTVVALDRPGYGASAPYPEAMRAPEQRVDLAYGAVEKIVGSNPVGAGLFVMAHSMGCELAIRMATDARGGDLLGLEVAGTGRRYQSKAADVLKDAHLNHRPPGLRDLLWQPARLYPPELLGAGLSSGGSEYEAAVVKTWAIQDFPALAGQVRVPVEFSAGDHENVWESSPAALADIAAMFTASPRVVANQQADSGHNLSVGLSAAAYHLKVFSFIEECVVARQSAGAELEAG
jgi:pimeloyl-ACP methyl ester carboxylesterase